MVELLDVLKAGADPDLVKPLRKIIDQRYADVFTGTKVSGVEARDDGLHVAFEGGGAPPSAVFDRVLVAVGRRPNGDRIAAEKAGVAVDDRGFIAVDSQQRTNVPHIFAIGDVVGQPMLAHKATHEGVVAAEVIAGMKSTFAASTIPAVADAQDIALTIDAHPTLSETVAFAAEAAEGTITDLYLPKRPRSK